MGREVRMVPPDWEHPKKFNDYTRKLEFIPLMDGFEVANTKWCEARDKWAEGFIEQWNLNAPSTWKPKGPDHEGMPFEEYEGSQPLAEDYMPSWPTSERTHFQMYEDTSEGTPISPIFATAEELARWLADTGASSFAAMTASYEAWLNLILSGSASISMVMVDGKIINGVEAQMK